MKGDDIQPIFSVVCFSDILEQYNTINAPVTHFWFSLLCTNGSDLPEYRMQKLERYDIVPDM